MSNFLRAAGEELRRARTKRPKPLNSAHEGYAVILEEVRELEAEVFKQQRTNLCVLEELVQVAAMCARMAEDLNLITDGEQCGRSGADRP